MAYDRHAALSVIKLTFDEYPGLTVQTHAPNLAAQILIEEAMPVLRRVKLPLSLAHLRAFAKVCGAMASAIVDWDLTNSGDPVPTTKAGLMAQDLEFVMALSKAWLGAVSGVPTPRPPATPQQPAEVIEPAPAPSTLTGLLPDGTDPLTGLDEEYLSQLPTVELPDFDLPEPDLVEVGSGE